MHSNWLFRQSQLKAADGKMCLTDVAHHPRPNPSSDGWPTWPRPSATNWKANSYEASFKGQFRMIFCSRASLARN